MIKDVLLQVSRSYNPYVQSNEIWGAGQTVAGELDNDFNARKFVSVGSDTNWELIDHIAIKTDGTLWAWGANSDGRLGFGDSVNRSSPTQLGTRTWVSASAGNSYVHAIRSDGTLWGWGNQSFFGAVLGDGTATTRNSPVQIGTHTWKQISNGQQSSLAIRSDDTLWGWGGSSIGELGNGEFPGTFGIIDNVSGPWNDVAVGRSYTLAIKTDGTMWAWGLNSNGQLGVGNTVGRSSAVQVGTLNNWASVATGDTSGNPFTIAIKTDGTLWAWGANSHGQHGDNTVSISRSSPIQIGTLTNWASASAGQTHVLATKTDGTLWGWGGRNDTYSYRGQLAANAYELRQMDGLTTWVSASAVPNGHSLTLKTDGTMWAWAVNTSGQVGDGTNVNRSSPIQIGTRTWKKISASLTNSYAIRDDDTIWSWGSNTAANLGIGVSGGTRSSPVQIGTLTWKQISSGEEYAMAIRSDDTLWGWGNNSGGHIGDGTGATRSSPVQIGTETWTDVACGRNHTIALRADGTLWGWGNNDYSQLGLNDTIKRSSPVQIGTRSDWSKISAGRATSGAIRSDGTLWMWGRGVEGQTGDGTNVNRSSPVQVGTRTDWYKILLSKNNQNTSLLDSNFAIRNDKTLWNWGQVYLLNQIDTKTFSSPVQIDSGIDWEDINASGLLASNGAVVYAITTGNRMYTGPGVNPLYSIWDNTLRSSPVQIGTETNWSKPFASDNASAALKTDGTLWGWGQANFGFPIINNSHVSVDSPVQIGTDTWSKFSIQSTNTSRNMLAIKTNGTLWAWGNQFTPLNEAISIIRSSPVQVGTRLWNEVSAYGVVAIRNDGTLWSWGSGATTGQGDPPISRSSPTQVGDKTDWYKVFGNSTHTAAIRTSWDYDLYTSGVGTTFNSTYEVVNGWTYPRKSPILVSQVNPWREIYSGPNHFIAIKTDGTLWGWGTDAFGQIGIGTVATVRSSAVQIGTRNDWSSISAGSTYTLGVRTDGTLWGWGINTSGELGLNVATNRSSPVQIGTRTWSKILASAQATSLAVRSDGTLWTWGQYPVGLNTSATNRSSPVQIGTETNWLSPQNGKYFTGTGSPVFARKINKSLYVYAAGEGVSNGISFYKSSPVQITSTRTWKSVHAGTSFTIAISNSGSIWAWGTEANGVLGQNTVTAGASQESPVQIGTLTSWVSASAGDGHILAVRTDGTMWGWGINNAGQLGLADLVTRSSPVQVGTLTNWSIVSAGRSHTMAIKSDGTLWGWGLNITNSQLGDGTAINRSSPVQIGTLTWTTVSAGVIHSAAIRNDNTLWAWGNNGVGQLGTGNVTSTNSPVQVGTRTWTDVAAGPSMTMAVRGDGTLWTWGLNTSGQLGLLRDRSRPNYVLATNLWTDAKAGYQSVIAKSTDGKLWGWGSNFYGNLGLGDTTHRSSPVQVGTLSWNEFSNGGFHVTAVKNGELWTWGDNSLGQLGLNLGTTAHRSSPVQVGTLTDWSRVDSGYLYSLAIKTDGTLWAWGNNGNGQLGDITGILRSSPVQVGTLNNWSKIICGFANSHAIKTDGTLWSWGFGTTGINGDNTSFNRSSPVQIGTRTWTLIADKGGFQVSHTMAIRNDGTLWAWGENTDGQLGLNNKITHSSPVQVGTRTDWIYAAIGDNTSMAIRSDGTLWAWGLNSSGELGLGDAVDRSSPVQVGTLSTWTSASLGDANSVLLQNNGYALTTGIYAHGYDFSFTINRSSPVQLGIDTNWEKVKATAANHPSIANGGQFIAKKTDGTLWTWGANTFGNLGDGTRIARSSPVQIGNDTTWVDFSAEGFHFVGIKRY